MLEPAMIASLFSGALVGLILGLIGGGGSILAVPLLVYVVGMDDPHAAIGTSALAVAVSAAVNLGFHARAGTVKWRCALVFAAFGVIGAGLGSTLGKITQGDLLLALFGLIMIGVGVAMLRRPDGGDDAEVILTRETAPRLLPRLGTSGLVVGALSGFFGIGGGFLIVPGLIAATAMPLLNSIGSSLVAVTAFGATTAGNYALAGWVDWPVAGLFIAGGAAGGFAGAGLAGVLGRRKNALRYLFSSVVIVTGVFIAVRAGADYFA